MKIYIPTLGRANRQKTYSLLPDSLKSITTLVVQEHEKTLYGEFPSVLVLPDNIRTITPTRRYIVDTAPTNKVIMLDDDIQFYIRRDDSEWRLRDCDKEDTERLFQELEKRLDTYAHVGVSGREGNNRVTADFVENTRYMRLLAYRKDFLQQIDHNRVVVMEDFDNNLQLLRKGHKSLVYYKWAQGQKQTNDVGGCSVWRTHKVHEDAATELSNLHPGFVKLVQKENKTGGEFGKRTEVMVFWKKAYESSQKEKKDEAKNLK